MHINYNSATHTTAVSDQRSQTFAKNSAAIWSLEQS